jgi:hypothetical protein
MTQPKKKPEPEPQEEPYTPMAAPMISTDERIEALTLRIETLEKTVSQHNKYHFSPISKG